MKAIYTSFILYPKHDEQAAGEPQGKTKNIDEGKCFATCDISPCGFEIIFEHKVGLPNPRCRKFRMVK